MYLLRARIAAWSFAAITMSMAIPTTINAAPAATQQSAPLTHARLQVSPAIKQHIMALLPGLRIFAIHSLEKQGEFVPIGAALPVSGKPTLDMVEAKHTARDMVIALETMYHHNASRHQYLSTAVMYDATKIDPATQKTTSAIAILFDDSDNFSLKFFFPYRLVGNQVQLGGTFYEPGEAIIFTK